MRTHDDNSIYERGKQASALVSVGLRAQLHSFIAPLLQQLDEQIDVASGLLCRRSSNCAPGLLDYSCRSWEPTCSPLTEHLPAPSD